MGLEFSVRVWGNPMDFSKNQHVGWLDVGLFMIAHMIRFMIILKIQRRICAWKNQRINLWEIRPLSNGHVCICTSL